MIAACLLLGCSGSAPAKPDHVYTVRGKIVQLPEPGKPASDLQIQHEPIPAFANKSGEIVGMKAMTMPFPVAAGVTLAGLSPGDVVEFTFEVRWSGSPTYQVTRIAKLPADTKLDFSGSG